MTTIETLQRYFGYNSFRPGQEEIINAILDGANVLAVLPTGAGKSLCYQIPALMSDNFSIVVSPLIALMKDQVDALNKNERIAAYLNSSMDFREINFTLNELSNGRVKLLFVSPEKLENSEFATLIKNLRPSFLFVDEAHCISEWGHNFRPSYRKIIDFINTTGITKVAAFTATANPEVQSDIIRQLNFAEPKLFIRGFERKNISLKVIKLNDKKEFLARYLEPAKLPAIIYCATRKQCESLAEFLMFKKLNAVGYHAGLSAELRKNIQDDFLSDRNNIIVATNAFGMGIDKSNIRSVIHFNIPSSIENYYQEFGRAGRDGEESEAVLLFTPQDKSVQQFMIESGYPTETDIRFLYNVICDFGEIALGTVNSKPIVLNDDFMNLLKLNKFNTAKLFNGIQTLIDSGYLTRPYSKQVSYKVRILLSPERLKRFVVSENNNLIKDLILLLLHEHGYNILDDVVVINFKTLGTQLAVEDGIIIKTLRWLNDAGIIEFIEPSNQEMVNVVKSRIKADLLYLDTGKINSLISNAKDKLASIISYTNSPECRFKFIIHYFGEDVAEYRCNKCDNCTGTTPENSTIDFIEEIILETLRDSRTPIRSNDLIKVLLGTSEHPGLKKLKNFGRIKHFGKSEIETSVTNLIIKNKIAGYEGVLKLSVESIEDIISADTEIKADDTDFKNYIRIYNQLKDIRKLTAKKFSQPEEMICSDDSLREIAETLPNTPSKLLSINGFNQRNFNKIGDEILSYINSPEMSEALNKNPKLPDELNKLAGLIKKKYSLNDILSITNLPEAVISMQIESLLQYDQTMEIDKLLDKNTINIIENEIRKGERNIKELKAKLGSEISYAKIRIVLAKFKDSVSPPLF